MESKKRILVVDDEPETLKALKGFLESFGHSAELAENGEDALLKLKSGIDLVLLDVKMPGMDGYEVARQIRGNPRTADIPIIMVTALGSKTDRLNAVRAGANDFVQKPIDITELKVRLDSLLKIKESQDEIKRQKKKLEIAYQAEKELLEKTLKGSVRILVEALGSVNPAAFSQSTRLRRYAQQICAQLDIPGGWQYELAAMLSQIGCFGIPTDILEKHYAGKTLSPEEEEMLSFHPAVGRDLLKNIPRLEQVAEIIAKQNDSFANYHLTDELKRRSSITVGAQILKVITDYDLFITRGKSHREAMRELRISPAGHDPVILSALQNLSIDMSGNPVEFQIRTVKLSELTTDMVLGEDLRTRGDRGILLARKGQEVGYPLIARLKNFKSRVEISRKIQVLIPREPGDSKDKIDVEAFKRKGGG